MLKIIFLSLISRQLLLQFWDRPIIIIMATSGGQNWKPHYPCDYYKQEYSDCATIGNRFHSYYVYGEKPECAQWKKDYEACTAWMKTQTEETKMIFLGHVSRAVPTQDAIKLISSAPNPSWKRPRGHPRGRWEDQIFNTLQGLGVTRTDWRVYGER
ncbi:C22orf39 [Branchiostoma lanceolatum]|uniref:Synaptic plasticity regulator PANTS n=1 Tax=Branchiostoma lanceolatum TaxID=7740 RepID=A0A8J9Z5Z4_BRALA|nr:C22orf39 [Branchiostoma lanceolatum]